MAKLFNRALQLVGENRVVGTPSITVHEYDMDSNVRRCEGPTVPTDGDEGYAIGCYFYKNSGNAAGTTVYINEGSETSADFNAIDSAGAGANTALSNLSSVAINTSLISDANNTDDLGSNSKQWKDLYLDGVGYIDTVQTDLIQEDTTDNGVVIDDVTLKDGGISGNGDITINTNKFTVTGSSGNTSIAGTLDVTGDVTLSGSLTVNGSFLPTGDWNVGGTLTADEVVLDTDGTAPASTNCYLVRDNSGDLTANAISGKSIHLAIAGTDEVDISASTVDFNGNDLDNAGYLIMNASTAPAGTEVYALNDNSGDLTLNAVSGKKVHVAVAGTDEFHFSGSEFEIGSGNNIQFLGDDDIVDSNDNELVTFAATGSAVNGIKIVNAATSNAPKIGSDGASAESNIGLELLDSNSNEALILGSTASAVNEVTITNAATGNGPTIEATGETNVDLNIKAKGSGSIVLTGEVQLASDEDILDSNGNEMFSFSATGSAVNEFTFTNAATSNAPDISVTGDDSNIDLSLSAKGSGVIALQSALEMSGNKISGNSTAGGDLTLESTTNGTKGHVIIASGDGGLKVGGTADHGTDAGDAVVSIFDGTTPPSGTLTNGASLYSAAGELTAIDSAGNTTVLSPHDTDGNYILQSYSSRKKRTLVIELEKLITDLAKEMPALKDYISYKRGKKEAGEVGL